MKSLKLSKSEIKKGGAPDAISSASPAEYPFGLHITLERESLSKLGRKVLDFTVGDPLTITAQAEVTSTASYKSSGTDSDSVGIQITHMEMSGGSKLAEYKKLKGKRPE